MPSHKFDIYDIKKGGKQRMNEEKGERERGSLGYIQREEKINRDKNCNFEKKDFVQKIKQHRKKGQGIYIYTHGYIYMHTKRPLLKD